MASKVGPSFLFNIEGMSDSSGTEKEISIFNLVNTVKESLYVLANTGTYQYWHDPQIA